METEVPAEELSPEVLQALLEKVWGKETVVHLRFERFTAEAGDLRVELDGDLRIKVVLGSKEPEP